MAKLNEYEFEDLLYESLKLFDEGCSVLDIRDFLKEKNVSSKDISLITDKLKNKILTDDSIRINQFWWFKFQSNLLGFVLVIGFFLIIFIAFFISNI